MASVSVKELSEDVTQAGYRVRVYRMRSNDLAYYGVAYSCLPWPWRFVWSHDEAMTLRERYLQDGGGGALLVPEPR